MSQNQEKMVNREKNCQIFWEMSQPPSLLLLSTRISFKRLWTITKKYIRKLYKKPNLIKNTINRLRCVFVCMCVCVCVGVLGVGGGGLKKFRPKGVRNSARIITKLQLSILFFICIS